MRKTKIFQILFPVTCCLLLITVSSTAQNNTLALNGAYIVMDGGTATNNIELVINQSNESGIVRLPGGGHIHSESQYNVVKWLTDEETGSYVFPFGVGGDADDYIPFTFNKTAGNSSVTMATWATDQQNSPKPNATNVPAVTHMSGTADSVLYAIDRFWDIQAPNTTADLTFSYLGSENTTINPNSILIAQHWNGTSWDGQPEAGTAGITTGVGTAGPYLSQDTFSPWMLTAQCTASINNSTAVICQDDSLFIGGDWQTIEGVYSDTIFGGNIFGCDSIINTSLTINTIDITTTTVAETISANASSPATYQWIDCNNGNAFIEGETGQSFVATATGDYAVIVTEGGCSDTSACVNINIVGIESYDNQNTIAIYPNPSTKHVKVVMDKFDPTTGLKLVDNLGKIVYQINPTSEVTIVDVESLSKGIYLLIISTEKNTVVKKIVKQ